MKTDNFSKTGDVQKYVNFINDNDLVYKLSNFETGYQSGSFFIDVEGPEDVIDNIKRLSMKTEKGKYKRTAETRKKQSKTMIQKQTE